MAQTILDRNEMKKVKKDRSRRKHWRKRKREEKGGRGRNHYKQFASGEKEGDQQLRKSPKDVTKRRGERKELPIMRAWKEKGKGNLP